MDGTEASLAIRRARRANAKSLDLSHRGLRTWPPDLFGLRQLESLDISGNELTSVDAGIAQLEMLKELDVSNNKLECLPAHHIISALNNLNSLVLDGNPVAAQMMPGQLRQMSRPPRTPGQDPVQVICSILAPASAPPPPPPPPSAGTGEYDSSSFAQVEELSSADGFGPSPPPPPPPAPAEEGARVRALLSEVERLQARVSELEAPQASGLASTVGPGSSSSVPSWLQDSKKSSLASTLPSRRGLGGFDTEDEATNLKNQLKEEQRKSKRMEQQVQRLTDRLSERDMSGGGVGSLPHFEMTEVELGDILNQGGFSVVHVGTWHGTKVAVKKLFDPNISAELLAEFDNEVQKLEQLRHPNILMALGLHRKPPALSLIMELVEGGSFYQLLHTPHQFNHASGPVGSLPFKETMDILDASGIAIAFLHARGVAHRDIKSHNVLLSPYLQVKVCDFGLARMRSELMTGTMQFAGTPQYMAPEIFRHQKYTESVDVFAFGTLVWEAMAVDIPFANLDPADIRDRVIQGQMLAMPSTAPREVQQLIQDCWTLDYKSRPPMAEVLLSLKSCRDGGAAGRTRRPQTAHAGSAGRSGGTLGGASRFG
eukprot:TRINITY_DN108971_c0_g1_i1.p1 TRINITY_DN108971_c0_g1~~TRINITY_DN108971_c0_g1_i1.p1  ORF type:complete len:599 (-),score=130.80 TRINITY_DN108971_c0_g1_i1:83-1879(-)